MKVALLKGDHRVPAEKYNKNWGQMVSALLHDGQIQPPTDYLAGRTALHWACTKDNLAFYHAYINAAGPGDWYRRDFGGKTPVSIARENNFKDLMIAMEADRRHKAGVGRSDIAIIGMGPAGTALFIRLIKRLLATGERYGPEFLKNHSFTLLDGRKFLGTGTPYAPELNSQATVLNVAAAGMSIDADKPLDFVLWLKELELKGKLEKELGFAGDIGLCPPSTRADGYYPRLVYARYLNQRLEYWVDRAHKAGIGIKPSVDFTVTEVQYNIKDPTPSTYKILGHRGADKMEFDVTHVYYTTGHFNEDPTKLPANLAYLKEPGAITFPANVDALEKKDLFKKPSNIAVVGSALSAVDAIFTILLKVGKLTWEANEPTFTLPEDKKDFKVTCYSRKGLFSKVRPQSNLDLDLQYLSLAEVARLRQKFEGNIPLAEVVDRLNKELTLQLKKDVNVDELADPFAQKDAAHRNPFNYLEGDIDWAENGDGKTPDQEYVRWYQVMHSLFPVIRTIYRHFSKKDRDEFDSKYGSNFLWAFAPMPLRSAKILMAMHKAGALELYRVSKEKGQDYPIYSNKKFAIHCFDYENKAMKNEHSFVCYTAGLAATVAADASQLVQKSINDGAFAFEDPYLDGAPGGEKSAWITDDDTFEILDKNYKHSSTRRGVGYFLRAQIFDVQAVPSVVKYSSQIADIYYDEFVHRFKKSVVTGHELK